MSPSKPANRVQTAYLGLGGNIGDRLAVLASALARLAAAPGVRIARISPVYETRAVGLTDQPDFLNLVVEVETTLSPAKTLRPVTGTALGADVAGYEMHMGETRGPGTAAPFALLADGASDGAVNHDGRVIGSYLHGLFASADLRRALLARIGVAGSARDYAADVDAALDDIAAELAVHADLDGLLALAGVHG